MKSLFSTKKRVAAVGLAAALSLNGCRNRPCGRVHRFGHHPGARVLVERLDGDTRYPELPQRFA